MRIGTALRGLHASEDALARELHGLAERHPAEHEVVHVARDLAAWSKDHVRGVADAARRYDQELDPTAADDVPDDTGAGAAGDDGATEPDGLAVLHDLRQVAMHAYGVSTEWEMVAQAAQAVRDHELLALCQRCHPGTLRQLRWANATIKVLSTQALTS